MASRSEFFWIFILLVPMIVIMVRRYFSGRKNLIDIAGKWRQEEFYYLYTVKSFFSSLGMLIFIAFAVLSLAGFPGKEIPVSYEPAGTDVIFVVDISESMKARDVSPSRLSSASRIIRSVCENTPGGRFGLIVFKGTGIKMIPSTEDVETVYNFLKFLNTDLLTSPGSNIQSGIETALSAFPGAEERKKYIILISDGEALSGDIDAVLGKVADDGVSIYSIGTGTIDGAEIPAADGKALRNSSGDIVMTRLDEQSLRYIADSTGGKYFSSNDSLLLPALIELVAGTIDKSDSRYKIVVKDNYRFFLIISLLGLMIYRIIKVIKWKKYF